MLSGPPHARRPAVVVGGGVSGLTTALVLQRRGFAVTLWTKDPVDETTSHVAAALWYPYRAGPEARVTDWCLRGFPEFERLASNPRAGVRLVEAVERLDAPLTAPPAWMGALPRCELSSSEMRFTTAVVNTAIYLPWLATELESEGGRIETRTARSLDEPFSDANVVINAAGLGARELAHDESLFPVRGQLLVVPPQGPEVRLHHSGTGSFTYVVPRGDHTVLGGTARDHATSLEADEDERVDVLRRAAALGVEPERVRTIRVGLRPCRPTVRLEVERRPNAELLAHNYGHGGAGVTLSWGCALELADAIERSYSSTMK